MRQIIDAMARMPLILAAVATVAMMVHVGVDVFARLFFYWHAPATMEITAYFYMVFIVFAGILHATLCREHISVEVFDRFFRRVRRPIEVFRLIVTLTYFAFFAYCGYFLAARSLRRREVVDALSFDLTVWPSKAFLFLSLAGCCIAVIAQIFLIGSRRENQARQSESKDDRI